MTRALTGALNAGRRTAGPVMMLTLLTAGLAVGCETTAATPGPGASPLPRQPGCTIAAADGSLCILILGDSIAAGTPLGGDDRWWPSLRRLLASALPSRVVVIDSWAVPGSQVDVLESAARDQPDAGSYDLAIVIEGVNDAHVLAVRDWRPRYEAAIAALEAQGLTVIVTAPPPRFENGVFDPSFDGVAGAVREVAGRGRPLIDLAARWRADGASRASAYYADAIHQGAVGQALMASMARDVVLGAVAGP